MKQQSPKVSASDIERYSYCPVSWELAKKGKSGKGESVEMGKTKHAQIHQKVQISNQNKLFKRQMII